MDNEYNVAELAWDTDANTTPAALAEFALENEPVRAESTPSVVELNVMDGDDSDSEDGLNYTGESSPHY